MAKVNKFQCWSLLTSLDIWTTWRFEVTKPHKAKNQTFHWIKGRIIANNFARSVSNKLKLEVIQNSGFTVFIGELVGTRSVDFQVWI